MSIGTPASPAGSQGPKRAKSSQGLMCSVCAAHVPLHEMKQGLAVRISGQVVCPICIDTLPADEQTRVEQMRALGQVESKTYRIKNQDFPNTSLFTFSTSAQLMKHRRSLNRGSRQPQTAQITKFSKQVSPTSTPIVDDQTTIGTQTTASVISPWHWSQPRFVITGAASFLVLILIVIGFGRESFEASLPQNKAPSEDVVESGEPALAASQQGESAANKPESNERTPQLQRDDLDANPVIAWGMADALSMPEDNAVRQLLLNEIRALWETRLESAMILATTDGDPLAFNNARTSLEELPLGDHASMVDLSGRRFQLLALLDHREAQSKRTSKATEPEVTPQVPVENGPEHLVLGSPFSRPLAFSAQSVIAHSEEKGILHLPDGGVKIDFPERRSALDLSISLVGIPPNYSRIWVECYQDQSTSFEDFRIQSVYAGGSPSYPSSRIYSVQLDPDATSSGPTYRWNEGLLLVRKGSYAANYQPAEGAERTPAYRSTTWGRSLLKVTAPQGLVIRRVVLMPEWMNEHPTRLDLDGLLKLPQELIRQKDDTSILITEFIHTVLENASGQIADQIGGISSDAETTPVVQRADKIGGQPFVTDLDVGTAYEVSARALLQNALQSTFVQSGSTTRGITLLKQPHDQREYYHFEFNIPLGDYLVWFEVSSGSESERRAKFETRFYDGYNLSYEVAKDNGRYWLSVPAKLQSVEELTSIISLHVVSGSLRLHRMLITTPHAAPTDFTEDQLVPLDGRSLVDSEHTLGGSQAPAFRNAEKIQAPHRKTIKGSRTFYTFTAADLLDPDELNPSLKRTHGGGVLIDKGFIDNIDDPRMKRRYNRVQLTRDVRLPPGDYQAWLEVRGNVESLSLSIGNQRVGDLSYRRLPRKERGWNPPFVWRHLGGRTQPQKFTITEAAQTVTLVMRGENAQVRGVVISSYDENPFYSQSFADVTDMLKMPWVKADNVNRGKGLYDGIWRIPSAVKEGDTFSLVDLVDVKNARRRDRYRELMTGLTMNAGPFMASSVRHKHKVFDNKSFATVGLAVAGCTDEWSGFSVSLNRGDYTRRKSLRVVIEDAKGKQFVLSNAIEFERHGVWQAGVVQRGDCPLVPTRIYLVADDDKTAPFFVNFIAVIHGRPAVATDAISELKPLRPVDPEKLFAASRKVDWSKGFLNGLVVSQGNLKSRIYNSLISTQRFTAQHVPLSLPSYAIIHYPWQGIKHDHLSKIFENNYYESNSDILIFIHNEVTFSGDGSVTFSDKLWLAYWDTLIKGALDKGKLPVVVLGPVPIRPRSPNFTDKQLWDVLAEHLMTKWSGIPAIDLRQDGADGYEEAALMKRAAHISKRYATGINELLHHLTLLHGQQKK